MASLAYWQHKASKRHCSIDTWETTRELDGKTVWIAIVLRTQPHRYSPNIQSFSATDISRDEAIKQALAKEHTAPK